MGDPYLGTHTISIFSWCSFIRKVRNGKMFNDECDSLSIKMALGIINFCINMVSIRIEATDGALNYLMSNMGKRNFDASMQRESYFDCAQEFDEMDNDGEKEENSMLKETICNKAIMERRKRNRI